jgi:hypothetical protein
MIDAIKTKNMGRCSKSIIREILNNKIYGDIVPYYLDYIYIDALEEVKPEAVTIY